MSTEGVPRVPSDQVLAKVLWVKRYFPPSVNAAQAWPQS